MQGTQEVQQKGYYFSQFGKFIRTPKECEYISKGSFGSVYKVIYENDPIIYALKKIKEAEILTAIKEVGLLWSLSRHPSFVNVYDFKVKYDSLKECSCSILMDFYPTTLASTKLTGSKFRKVAFQLVSGLAYMKKLGILHRDIKAANILYNPSKNKAVFTDIGMGVVSKNIDLSEEVCTIITRAPEIICCKEYDIRSDVWSLGVTLYWVYTNKNLYWGTTRGQCVQGISEVFGGKYFYKNCPVLAAKRCSTIPAKNMNFEEEGLYHTEIKEFLTKMLVVDPSNRATPSELLNLPLFDGFKKKNYRSMKRELVKVVDSNKLIGQPIITYKMYKILVDWLVMIMKSLKFKKSTLIIATDFLRRYLAKEIADKGNLQGVGISCFYISCLLYDRGICFKTCVKMCDNMYTEEVLGKIMLEVLAALDYDLFTGYTGIYDLYGSYGNEKDVLKDVINKVMTAPEQDEDFHLNLFMKEE